MPMQGRARLESRARPAPPTFARPIPAREKPAKSWRRFVSRASQRPHKLSRPCKRCAALARRRSCARSRFVGGARTRSRRRTRLLARRTAAVFECLRKFIVGGRPAFKHLLFGNDRADVPFHSFTRHSETKERGH